MQRCHWQSNFDTESDSDPHESRVTLERIVAKCSELWNVVEIHRHLDRCAASLGKAVRTGHVLDDLEILRIAPSDTIWRYLKPPARTCSWHGSHGPSGSVAPPRWNVGDGWAEKNHAECRGCCRGSISEGYILWSIQYFWWKDMKDYGRYLGHFGQRMMFHQFHPKNSEILGPIMTHPYFQHVCTLVTGQMKLRSTQQLVHVRLFDPARRIDLSSEQRPPRPPFLFLKWFPPRSIMIHLYHSLSICWKIVWFF